MPTQIHRFFESLESRTLLHAGDIDPAFNSGQPQTTDFASGGATITTIDVLPDGSFFAGGIAFHKVHGISQQFAVAIAKYHFDGSIDTSFGSNGQVTATPRGLFSLNQIATTSDGGFLAAGLAADNSTPIVVKYNPDGTIDTTFGKNGKLDLGSLTDLGTLSIQANGDILVPGQLTNDADLRRYLPTGEIDASFAAAGDFLAGLQTTTHTGKFNGAIEMNDGRILVTGSETRQFTDSSSPSLATTPLIFRLNGQGTQLVQDTKFMRAANRALSGVLEQVARQLPNGNIVFVGAQLMELKLDGTINTAYGDNGVSDVAANSSFPVGNQAAIADDGSVILPVDNGGSPSASLYVERVAPSGHLDTTFGDNGSIHIVDISARYNSVPDAIALAPDGTLLVGAQSGNITASHRTDARGFLLGRYFTTAGPAVQLIPRTLKTPTSSLKMNINVLIRDNDGVDTSALDNSDLKFVDLGGYFHKIRFVSSSQIDGNDYIQATYSMTAPNGGIPENPPEGWAALDNGSYQIRLAGSQIKDLLGNSAEAQILGNITIKIPSTA